MMGAFHCPHCGTANACACESCAPHIKEGEYVNKWTEDGEAHICGKCSKVYSPDQSLDEEFRQRKTYTEEDVKNAFLDGWQLREGDLPFPKAKNKWFNEFKKQIR